MSQSSAQQIEKRWQLLTDITTQREINSSKRITYALKRTLELLKLDIGILSSIEGKTYTVVEFIAPEGALHRGQTFDLGNTYCSITLQANHVISINHMKESEHNRHPCYTAFQLETYIGTPVFVQGRRYGTLNFSSPTPHNTPFGEEDRQLLDMLATWVSSELEQEAHRNQFSSLLDAIPIPMLVINIEGDIVRYANREASELTQIPIDKLIDHSAPKLYADPNDDPRITELMEKHGAIHDMEVEIVNMKGVHYWLSMSVQVIDYDGEPCVLSTFVDVTQQKQMMGALQESQQDLRAQYESSPEATGVLNTQTGLFENPNKNAELLYGLPYDELIKVGPAHMSPEFQPDGRPSGEQAMEKIKEALEGKLPVFDWIHINSAGEEIPCEIRLVGLGGQRAHLVRFSVTDIRNRIAVQEELRQRARELEIVTEVSTKIASIQDLDDMLQTMVDLTKERFDLYHTHVFLIKDEGFNLTLTKGAGEVGRHMVAEGRTIPVSAEESLIASTARTKQSQIREYQGEMEGYMPHPFLIDTRTEMALPLVAGQDLVGVLDVRSAKEHAFGTTEQQIFETLAAQVAISIRNAQSFAESERNRYELDMLTRRLTREGWQNYFQTDGEHRYGLDRAGNEVLRADLPQSNEMDDELSNLDESLEVQGEMIGQIKLHQVGRNTDDLQAVLTAVADSLSTHIESLRLSEQTHNALTDADILYQVTTKLNASQTYDEILEAIATQSPIARNAKYIGLNYFDRPWTDEQRPEMAEAIALWHDNTPIKPTSFHKFKLDYFPKTMSSIEPNRPLLVSNMVTDERIGDPFRNIYLNVFKCKSNAIFPLSLGPLWIGYLDLVYEDVTEFNPAEVERFTTLAQQIAISSQTIYLNQQRARSLAETATLYQGSEQISRASTYGEALRALIDSLDVVKNRFDRAHLILFDKAWQDDQKPRYMILHGDWDKETDQIAELNVSIPLDTFTTDFPFKQGEPHYIPDVDQEESFSPYLLQGLKNNYDTKSILDLPLISSGEWIGRLSLHCKGELPALNEGEMRLVTNLTDQIATVTQGLRLFRQAQSRAEREAQVRNITNQIRRGNNQYEILQIARNEIAVLLKASKSEAKLGTSSQLREALQKRAQKNES